MFRWIKRLFGKAPSRPLPQPLTVIINGQIVQGVVTDCIGLRLKVNTAHGSRLVGPSQVVSQLEFQRIWNEYAPHLNYTWEDGTPFSLD